jgi:hypothetical protein
MEGTSLVIVGQGAAGPRAAEFADLSEQILAAIVDEYEVTRADDTVTFRMVRHQQHQ